MTLILICISRECAMQVSDRKVTWSDGSNRCDDRNKAVMLGVQAAFSYSGLAEIGGERTDKWLARVLSNSSTSNRLEAIRSAATVAFRRMSLASGLRRHAFVWVGWDNSPRGLRPFLGVISNAVNDRLQWEPAAEDEFIQRVMILATSDDPVVVPIGVWHDKPQTRKFIREVKRAARRGASNRVRDLLSETIRFIASIDPLVGKDLLAIVMPKGAMAPSTSPSATTFSGLLLGEVYHLPSADPSRAYRCAPITVIGDQVLDGF